MDKILRLALVENKWLPKVVARALITVLALEDMTDLAN